MILQQLKLSYLILIYKTIVDLAITCQYVRATKGKLSYRKFPNNQGKNITLIGTLVKLFFYFFYYCKIYK